MSEIEAAASLFADDAAPLIIDTPAACNQTNAAAPARHDQWRATSAQLTSRAVIRPQQRSSRQPPGSARAARRAVGEGSQPRRQLRASSLDRKF